MSTFPFRIGFSFTHDYLDANKSYCFIPVFIENFPTGNGSVDLQRGKHCGMLRNNLIP